MLLQRLAQGSLGGSQIGPQLQRGPVLLNRLLPAAEASPPIARAINIYQGELTNHAVAETFDIAYNKRFEV